MAEAGMADASGEALPTWGEIAAGQNVPLDEALRTRGLAMNAAPARDGTVRTSRVVGQRQQAGDGSLAQAKRRTIASTKTEAPSPPRDPKKPFCDYDSASRRLRDFVLPDVQGRPVAFRDLDADLILLDFWGTWCAPCRESIPHLTELQDRFPDKRLLVVGIACERTEPDDRAAKVVETVKTMKINYPVLLTAMDGSCPLQEALKIQFYPTMVLLDREGRVLWRDQGATSVTLARLDRFISSALK
jgi:thiol-disulfide isomerase/thioredoxin